MVNLPGSEKTADVAACPVPEHKAKGLQNCHQRKDDPGGSACRYTDFADKKSVRRVVDGGDHHADDRRHGERENQFGDRCLRHPFIFCFFVGQSITPCFCFKIKSAYSTIPEGKMQSCDAFGRVHRQKWDKPGMQSELLNLQPVQTIFQIPEIMQNIVNAIL